MVMGFLTSLFGRSRPNWAEGGLYYTRRKDGSYSVLKILKIDDQGVHVRLYSNQFAEPPKKVDETTLHMAGLHQKPNENLGIGHMPISKKSFVTWHATFVQQCTVSEEELDGYKVWLDDKGGYF
jgi:hypothetical protein